MANLPHKQTPTRFPKGVTNNDPRHVLARMKLLDAHKSAYFHSDFFQYVATDWTETLVGTGTNALVAGDGGILQMTTTAGATDSNILSKTPANLTLVAGYQTWFRAALTLSDITNSRFLVGLTNAITTFTITDGVYFNKPTAAATVNFVYTVGSSSTTTALPVAVTALANATQFTIGAYYDGVSTLAYFFNDAQVGSITINATGSPALPSVNLTQSMGFQNGAAAAKNMKVDFISSCKDRADRVMMLP